VPQQLLDDRVPDVEGERDPAWRVVAWCAGVWLVLGLCTLLTVPVLGLSMWRAFSSPWPLPDRIMVVVGIVAGVAVWIAAWSRFNSFVW
jgi:hypothetical protein